MKIFWIKVIPYPMRGLGAHHFRQDGGLYRLRISISFISSPLIFPFADFLPVLSAPTRTSFGGCGRISTKTGLEDPFAESRQNCIELTLYPEGHLIAVTKL
jgi:hypothetical protein